MDQKYVLIYNKKKDCSDIYSDYLGLNTFMYSSDGQIDFILDAILRSEELTSYSYKNGTRAKKGHFYKDE